MAKRRVTAKRSTGAKKSLYRTQTLGIKFDSLTFLVLCVFVLAVAVVMVSRMLGLGIF